MNTQERRVLSVLRGAAGLILFAFSASVAWPPSANAMAPSKSWEKLHVTESAVICEHRTQPLPYTPCDLLAARHAVETGGLSIWTTIPV